MQWEITSKRGSVSLFLLIFLGGWQERKARQGMAVGAFVM
jgi:hypothetical protein